VAPCAGYIRGSCYLLIWYSSILLGFYFLYAPLLPLLLVSRPTYRRLTDTLFQTWEAFNTVSFTLVYTVHGPNIYKDKLRGWIEFTQERGEEGES
jgi:hypothetical protein